MDCQPGARATRPSCCFTQRTCSRLPRSCSHRAPRTAHREESDNRRRLRDAHPLSHRRAQASHRLANPGSRGTPRDSEQRGSLAISRIALRPRVPALTLAKAGSGTARARLLSVPALVFALAVAGRKRRQPVGSRRHRVARPGDASRRRRRRHEKDACRDQGDRNRVAVATFLAGRRAPRRRPLSQLPARRQTRRCC